MEEAAEGNDYEGPAVIPIPGLCEFPSCELAFRWAAPGRLALHSKADRDERSSEQPHHVTHTFAEQVTVYEVEWSSTRWNAITRKLVNQSHGYFMSLQQEAAEEEMAGNQFVRFSRLYRSALHECVLGLKRKSTDPDLSFEESQSYEEERRLYSILELVWHLCEVLFIEQLPVGCLIQQLLEWVRWHSNWEEGVVQTLLLRPDPEGDDSYWQAVYGLVLRGRFSDARLLLSHHSFSHTAPEAFASIDELLRKAPMARPTGNRSRPELQRAWQEWRAESVRRVEAGHFLPLPQLQLLANVLCGDAKAFAHQDIVGSCQWWWELMVGKLLFTLPLVVSTDFELDYTAKDCIKLFPETGGMAAGGGGTLQAMLLAALRHDALDVIKLASSSVSGWWFVAHLTNLLYHAKELVSLRLEYGSKLSEFLTLEYASGLMAHSSLWQIGLDYLNECHTNGRAYMVQFIECVPLTSERKALKVLRLCEKYQLMEQVKSVCRVLAMRAFRSGRLGVALSWCLRSKDSAFAAYLAEKYFDSYQSLGEFMDLDLLDHLGNAILLSEKLMFLSKYREFHRLHKGAEFREAGEILMALLMSDTVPRRFWPTILTDALCLLEVDELVFNSEQTFKLLHFLQQLTLSPPEPASTAQSDRSTAYQEKLSLLRLALTRNLARATLEESTTS